VTRYLDRVLAGEQPTSAEWNEHLIAFHRAHAGLTPALVSQMRTPQGRSSYDVLVERIKALAPSAGAILDVGCGEGTLLRELTRAFGPSVALAGVDLSDDELARARAVSPDVRFIRGDASVVGLGQKSYDVATSHLVFMAMPEIGRVLAQVRAALRGDGMLIFVCEDPLSGGVIFDLVGEAIAILRGRLRRFAPGVPRREPIERDEALCAVLRDAGFATTRIERFPLRGKLTEDQLWSFIEQCYPLGLLEPALQGALHDAMRSRLRAMACSDSVADLPLRLVVACAQ